MPSPHMHHLVAALGALALAASVPALAADWPQFGQTPKHGNANPSERAFTPDNVGSLVVKWNANMGSNVSTEGGAVIAGQRLFVAGFDGRISAFDIDGCGADVCDPIATLSVAPLPVPPLVGRAPVGATIYAPPVSSVTPVTTPLATLAVNVAPENVPPAAVRTSPCVYPLPPVPTVAPVAW